MYEKSPSEIRYRGALFLSSVFKALAVLTVLGGLLVAGAGAVSLRDGDRLTNTIDAVVLVAWLIGAGLSAAFLAFFGYVLEILVDIGEGSWLALDDEDEDEDDIPNRAAA